uniref:Uncharacterized protein n=1 Tax=Romanomermis culicivorax TaxID=13658 RepID=A0A915K455_ROMCU
MQFSTNIFALMMTNLLECAEKKDIIYHVHGSVTGGAKNLGPIITLNRTIWHVRIIVMPYSILYTTLMSI